MNKTIPALTLLCGFLMGVIAGPWLWPRDLLGPPSPPPSLTPKVAIEAEVLPVPVELPAPPPSEVKQEEPELVLKGVLVGADATRSRALIAQGLAEPRLYKPDDKLPDGSVLKSVNNKQVEIEKNGETIQLTLDRGRPVAASDDEQVPSDTNSTPAETETPTAELSSSVPVTASSETAVAPE